MNQMALVWKTLDVLGVSQTVILRAGPASAEVSGWTSSQAPTRLPESATLF